MQIKTFEDRDKVVKDIEEKLEKSVQPESLEYYALILLRNRLTSDKFSAGLLTDRQAEKLTGMLLSIYYLNYDVYTDDNFNVVKVSFLEKNSSHRVADEFLSVTWLEFFKYIVLRYNELD